MDVHPDGGREGRFNFFEPSVRPPVALGTRAEEDKKVGLYKLAFRANFDLLDSSFPSFLWCSHEAPSPILGSIVL